MISLQIYFDARTDSPLGWSHISLTGDYLWEQAAIAVDGFGPSICEKSPQAGRVIGRSLFVRVSVVWRTNLEVPPYEALANSVCLNEITDVARGLSQKSETDPCDTVFGRCLTASLEQGLLRRLRFLRIMPIPFLSFKSYLAHSLQKL